MSTTDASLPPLPPHPEHYHVWTEREAQCLADFASRCYAAGKRSALAQQAPAVAGPELARMTSHRAVFFLERFKREEKLLGPNEQAALVHAIGVLERDAEKQTPAVAARMKLTDTDIAALSVPRGVFETWDTAPAAQQAPAAPKRCVYCDDTGDVTRADGEWLGVCHCPAGDKFRAQQAPAAEPVALSDEPHFTPRMIEAIYAAWHGAGVDIAGGNWKRFVGMLAAAPQPPQAQPLKSDARKLCTCDGAGMGAGRACVVKAGGRLGDLWCCAEGAGAA